MSACGGCGATKDAERCIGCFHDFGDPASAWVHRYGTAPLAVPLALPPCSADPEPVESVRLPDVPCSCGMFVTFGDEEVWDGPYGIRHSLADCGPA